MNKLIICICLFYAGNLFAQIKNCNLSIKPFYYNELTIGSAKSDILKDIENISVIDDKETLKYLDENTELFESCDSIELPNGQYSSVILKLRFDNNVLDRYSVVLDIGTNKSYFNTVLSIIKKYDEKGLNSFIGDKFDKYRYVDFQNSCFRSVVLERKPNTKNSFQIRFKAYRR